MSSENLFFRAPVWTIPLAPFTFHTWFVKLRPEAVEMLASGAGREKKISLNDRVSKQVIKDLTQPMDEIPGNSFAFVDECAPTDTERYRTKRGAVFSPRSAWFYLLTSEKVASAAAAGRVEYICLRPFRNITRPREFRLFIVDGVLSAMSQYHLDRHYFRLDGVKQKYWKKAQHFVEKIAWRLPVKTLVMDIYITSSEEILIIDLNPWGGTTDPLLLRSWERDWSEPAGIVLMDPPMTIHGDVKVSF